MPLPVGMCKVSSYLVLMRPACLFSFKITCTTTLFSTGSFFSPQTIPQVLTEQNNSPQWVNEYIRASSQREKKNKTMRRGGHEQPGARERMRSELSWEAVDMAELAAGLLYTVGAEEFWAKTCHYVEGEREAWCEARATEDGGELIWNKYREDLKSGDG